MKRLIVFAAILWSAGTVLVVSAATLTVRSGSYYFEDATVGDGRIVARVGDRLQVITEDGGRGTPHTVDVDELAIHSGSLGTNSTYTTPVLDRPGTFLLYCKPHRNKGHYTNLVVLANATPSPTRTLAPTPASTTAPSATPTPAQPTSPADQLTPTPNPTATLSGAVALGPGRTGEPTTSTASDEPASTLPENEEAIGSSGGAQVRGTTTTWLRSVFVGFLALGPVLALTVLAGWRSSRRRSS